MPYITSEEASKMVYEQGVRVGRAAERERIATTIEEKSEALKQAREDIKHLDAEIKRLRAELAAEHEQCAKVRVAYWRSRNEELAAERERCAVELKDRIDARLNNVLCEMKEGYDDSITGFNEAWDIVRSVFAAAIRKGE